MSSPVTRRAALVLLLKAPLALAACGVASDLDPLSTQQALPSEVAAVTASPSPLPTETPQPAVTPSPTPLPPSLELRPPSVLQGGTATVVLNEPATSATATFQQRQYPMVRSGERMWAVLGTGAFTEPGPYRVSVSYTPPGQTATQTATANIEVGNANYQVESIILDPDTAALLAPNIIQNELAQRAHIYGVFTPQRLWTGPFVRPSTAPLSDTYGVARSYNGSPATDYHRGTDFAGQTGDPAVAAAAGKVAFVGALMVRGNSVIIDHGVGVFTAYHHFSAIRVEQGQNVVAGQQIGAIGATGLVTGPHLHFEVLVRGLEVDAELWLNGVDFGL